MSAWKNSGEEREFCFRKTVTKWCDEWVKGAEDSKGKRTIKEITVAQARAERGKRGRGTVMKVTENVEAGRGSGVTPRSAPKSNKQNLPEKDPTFIMKVIQDNPLLRKSTNYP